MNVAHILTNALLVVSMAGFPYVYHIPQCRVHSRAALSAYHLRMIESTLVNYQSHLQTIFQKKVHRLPEIYIYASVRAFQEELGVARSIGGLSSEGRIYLQPLSILNRTQRLIPLLKHEYTHIFLEDAFPHIPFFLNEGISAFFSALPLTSQPPVPYENLLRWDEGLLRDPSRLHAYLSSSRNFVAQIVREHGVEKLLELLEKENSLALESLYREYFKLR